MDRLLIIGAGRSATSMIDYALEQAEKYNWIVTVADYNLDLANDKVKGNPHARAVKFDVNNYNERVELVTQNDVVVSMLPAFLHNKIADVCLEFNTHLLTASYVSQHMAELSRKAEEKGLIFMGEMGLDPGLDHMSAMEHIDRFRSKNIDIISFKSYTGGLIAPEYDDNPWHYKFTWNPRNVILAGQGTAQYLHNGKLKYIPYNRLFSSAEKTHILNAGDYEVYANRDSLLYREIYNLEDIPTIFRGTIRNVGFSASWNAFVQLGLTDDTYPILHSETITYNELIDAFTNPNATSSTVKGRVAETLSIDIDSEIMNNLEWTGIFSDDVIGLDKASPAKILEELLLSKWKLGAHDKDMIIMQHEFRYIEEGIEKELISSLKIIGEDQEHTAMAKTVGLPLGILTKLVMQEKIKATYGVHIPVKEYVYKPVLDELKEYGINFDTVVRELEPMK